MNFNPTEIQQQLADSVRRYLGREYDFAARRAIVESASGESDAAWSAFADIGLLGLPIASDYGGFGGGAVDLMGTMEAFGDALVVEPYLATVLAAQLVARAGTTAQKESILPEVAAGKCKMALAHSERDARYDLAHVAARADVTASGYAINGRKCVVLHGATADWLLVSARTRGNVADIEGISLFLVAPDAAGVSVHDRRTLDGMRAADVAFDDVRVDAAALIGVAGEALPVIEEVIDFATALICAEAVGAIRYANAATLAYLKTRQQFGVPIGDFQALQHRMVDMVISGEQAESMASLACTVVDSKATTQQRKSAVSAAKIRVAQACRHVSQEAVQLHGGMGMTDELKVSHTFRRLTTIAQQFGDAEHHLARFASLDVDDGDESDAGSI